MKRTFLKSTQTSRTRKSALSILALSLLIAQSGAILPVSAAPVISAKTSSSSDSSTSFGPRLVASLDKAASPWWQHAVFYEIYPRSFKDSNGDGIGDINGITEKLDYLHDLGIDAIWLTPCYPSPQVDFGYDISDYCAIAPEYGTMADFDRLLAEAKKRNIKIVMDFVVNHTSDKHPWFEASKSSKTDPKRDWYIWRDGKNGGPPNNWQSLFGHSAWKLDPKTNQYYYHFFYAEQPDLNWRNPELRKAMMEVARFWLKRGVAGFRLDAVGCLFEDTALHDNPVLPGTNAYGDINTEYKYNDQYPEVHDIMRELRAVLDTFPGADHPVLIGETAGPDVKKISSMYGANLDEIQLPMNFFFAYLNKRSATDFRKLVSEWDSNPAHGWPLYFFSNHDQVRHYVRYGNDSDNDAIAKLMATLLMTIRGTPLMYYGEELGMENNDPKRVEDVFDPIGKIGWPKEKGRDGERTPMQWTDGEHAGFSTVKPWLTPPASFASHNVATEKTDPASLLNFYKKLMALHHKQPFMSGAYEPINVQNKDVFAYLRKGDNQVGNALVVLNFTDREQIFKPEINGVDLGKAKCTVLIEQGASDAKSGDGSLNLKPFGIYVAEINK